MTQAGTTTPKVRTFGSRVSRSGEVFAYTEPPVRGRCRASKELLVGHVRKVPGGWRHDAACDIYPRQSDAAIAVIRITCN
jgi:hypothetical protein